MNCCLIDIMSAYAYTYDMEIRFSRQAKNKLRLYKISNEEAKRVVEEGERTQREGKEESVLNELRIIWIIEKNYALVITVIRK